MPEGLKGHLTKKCERLDAYCKECVAIGSTDCVDHGGPPSSGESSVLGKRHGDDFFDKFLHAKHWGRQGGSLKSDAKSFPSRLSVGSTSEAPPALVPLAVSIDDNDGQEEPERDESSPREAETGAKDAGVRFREKLGKFVVEYRPSRFKWKLWMGTYTTIQEGRRACDCARFYAGPEKGDFYFRDSPALFRNLGPLPRPFPQVSKEVRDKPFNQELKRRAKQVIKQDNDALKAKQAATPAPPPKLQPVAHNLAVVNSSPAPTSTHVEIHLDDPVPTSSQESLATNDQLQPSDEHGADADHDEAGSAAGPDIDPYQSLGDITHGFHHAGFSPADWCESYTVPTFPMYTGDEPEVYFNLQLWDHAY